HKLRYIGNGVVLDKFLEQVVPVPVRSAKPMVLMVSRLVKEKGCADFLEIARNLSDRACFVHIGPSEDDQRDAISAEEIARASQHVSFIGAVDDIRPYLAAADIVALPSYREGIPRVAMEAAAAGKPVVAYDVRGVREVIDPTTGLLAPRGDIAALQEVVVELLEDPERRSKLGEACRDRVVDLFSEEGVIERLRVVYRELVGGVVS
ncbi:MAG TPA: glycosyltransferase, partial [Acidimicrobiales bacterium]|nr:glycosyltransferase [Acidimicrobiales bacterium]